MKKGLMQEQLYLFSWEKYKKISGAACLLYILKKWQGVVWVGSKTDRLIWTNIIVLMAMEVVVVEASFYISSAIVNFDRTKAVRQKRHSVVFEQG